MSQPAFVPRACPSPADVDPAVDVDPTVAVPVPVPAREYVTARGMHVACYELPLDVIPVDFFADPDGAWTFESLVEAGGFSVDEGVAVGALREPFGDHPEGAAVVTLNCEARPYVAIIECPIAFVPVAQAARDVNAA